MDYDTVLAHVLDLLQREQRVAYRVLKRRLQLDDELLEDLKDDLIYAKKLAVDEDGRVLVWTGRTSSALPTASPMPPPATAASPTRGEAAPAIPSTPDAERRQLTVMFCDLVDSTRLSSQLDPEEYREMVRAYQRVCTDVIQPYDGHIAQLLGDGLLVYFGYPQAHEDDAHRAVRTGLGILAAMEDLNTRLQREKGIQLALRMGIHTGLVVIGAMGDDGRHEHLALGETPNIAARIQGLAAPHTIAISDATYRLVHGYFACQDLGAQSLRGVTEAVRLYHVLGESGARGRLDVAQPRGLTPLVGREAEVTLLQERWAQAKSGQGQVVLLMGDPGIGKSRLVQVLKEHVAQEPHTRWECRSAEYYQNTALYPLTDLFQRLLQWQLDETPDAKLGKLEHALSQYRLPREDTVPLFAPLLSLPIPEHIYPPLNLSPQRQRQKTLETIVTILLELAKRQPVVFILEDLHWADPTTLELLNLAIEQIPTTAVLMVLTCRPHFQPAWHHRSYITEMTLNHLSHAQVEQIVNRLTDGKAFPAEVLQQIIAKTDGVPLFVEETTKAILESGQLKVFDEHYELTAPFSTFAIPATLHDSLMARLDRLVTAKAVAQYAAVIGRQFSYDLLSTVLQLDEATLQRELGRLVEAEIVYQRGVPPQATYFFKHALIQDAAYQSLLRSTRQQYHQRIAQVLEAQFPETVTTQPELLAYHYTEAGLVETAIPYWQQAGQRAIQRSANLEAISHLTKGLEVLKTLPDSPERLQHELDLQITLGQALAVTRGYAAPEVEHTYARARELCQQAGETPQLFPVLRGLWNFHLIRREVQTARELAEQLLSLAQRAQEPALLQQAHSALAGALVHLGEFAAAHAHLQQGLALYDPAQHRTLAMRLGYDLGVFFLAYMTRPLWLLGYPDQALRRSQEALTLAQELAHPFSLAYALTFAVWLHQLRREDQATHARAEALCALAREQGFAFLLASGMMHLGWALAEQGQGMEGMVQMREGMAAYRATGSEVDRAYFLALLAEVYGQGKQGDEGLTVLEEALSLTDQQASVIWEAELHRLKGELLLTRSAENQVEAEACFHQALAVAQHQEAKSLELRAAMSLARLWQQQGKRAEAYELLAPIYGWFTEGFDTMDLQEARALLEALA
jgi:predicted ATPase/class 3 adenylate cyclase